MARINNLTNFLNDVATAIKTKLGDSTNIPAAEFDNKIMEIETAGNYQNKSTTITTNGNYNLLPDTGFDAMGQVDIEVNVPSPDLSDATAKPEDIVINKTAYTGNGKQIGTLVLPEFIYGTSNYNNNIQSTKVKAAPEFSDTSFSNILVCKKWIISTGYGDKNIYFYYDGVLVGSIQKATQYGHRADVLMTTETEIYIAINISDTNFETFKADYTTNTVTRVGSINFGSSTTRWYSNGTEIIVVGRGETISRYQPETNTIKSYINLGVSSVGNMSVPGMTYCNYSRTDDDKTVSRYRYNQSTDSYTFINKHIEQVVGVNYYGDKIFLKGNVYRLSADLTVGELLTENAYPHQTGAYGTTMTCLNEKYYWYNSSVGRYLYEFNETTNQFTEITLNIPADYHPVKYKIEANFLR